MARTNPIQVQKYLKGMNYPASRDDLVAHAEDRGADDEILAMLEDLSDEIYETPAEVSQAIGGLEK